jgi:short-subunit dehydrogenase
MKILITGATSGIGRQLAEDYHLDGHEVWAVGRNAKVLDDLSGMGLSTGQLDLTDRGNSLAWFVGLDKLDLAILNAGTCEYMDMPDFDSALFIRVMRANVESMAISIEGVLPLLLRSNRPHLACVGSSAAYLPLPRAEAYGSSKAAVAYLAESLRITLTPQKVTVSLISPGFVQTPLTDRNDFPMPFRVTVKEASRVIRRGLARGKAEIHFPLRFTVTMKIAALLPRPLWAKIAAKMLR